TGSSRLNPFSSHPSDARKMETFLLPACPEFIPFRHRFVTSAILSCDLEDYVPVRKRYMNDRPDFFIVGAPRSGTTAMAQFLSGHPDIFMARKEMHVFGADLRFGRRFYRRDLPTYLAEFRGHGRRRAGEASVWYLFSAQAAAEIKRFNPEA